MTASPTLYLLLVSITTPNPAARAAFPVRYGPLPARATAPVPAGILPRSGCPQSRVPLILLRTFSPCRRGAWAKRNSARQTCYPRHEALFSAEFPSGTFPWCTGVDFGRYWSDSFRAYTTTACRRECHRDNTSRACRRSRYERDPYSPRPPVCRLCPDARPFLLALRGRWSIEPA